MSSKVLRTTHSLHLGTSNQERTVSLLLTFSEVHKQLLSFADVKILHFVQLRWRSGPKLSSLYHQQTLRWRWNCGWTHSHVCVKRVENRAQNSTLWGSCIQSGGAGGGLAQSDYLRSASKDLQHPVTKMDIQTMVLEFGDKQLELWVDTQSCVCIENTTGGPAHKVL